jgi:hypothetical protein
MNPTMPANSRPVRHSKMVKTLLLTAPFMVSLLLNNVQPSALRSSWFIRINMLVAGINEGFSVDGATEHGSECNMSTKLSELVHIHNKKITAIVTCPVSVYVSALFMRNPPPRKKRYIQ